MMITVLGVSIIACDKEKEDKDSGSDVDKEYSTIEGTWSGGEEDNVFTISFKKDGTGTYVNTKTDSDTHTFSGTFTYTMTGNNSGCMVVKYRADYFSADEYESEMCLFVIIDDKLYFMEGEDGAILSNNNGSSVSIKDNTIEGTWSGGEENNVFTISFKKDGTGTYVNTTTDSDTHTFSGTFTYTMTSNNSGFMIVKYRADYFATDEYENEMCLFVIVDDKLYFMEGEDGATLSNNNGGSVSIKDSTIEGTWSGGEEDNMFTISFKKDGTGTYINTTTDSSTHTFSGTFTYTMTGNNSGFMVVKVRADYFAADEYESEMCLFVIVNDKLYFMEGEEGAILSKQ